MPRFHFFVDMKCMAIQIDSLGKAVLFFSVNLKKKLWISIILLNFLLVNKRKTIVICLKMEKALMTFMCLFKERIFMYELEKESMICGASNGCSHVSCVPSSLFLVLPSCPLPYTYIFKRKNRRGC